MLALAYHRKHSIWAGEGIQYRSGIVVQVRGFGGFKYSLDVKIKSDLKLNVVRVNPFVGEFRLYCFAESLTLGAAVSGKEQAQT